MRMKVMITHNVKSSDGLGFDGNLDGVGSGTSSDDRLMGDFLALRSGGLRAQARHRKGGGSIGKTNKIISR